jgi:hypothetical protein
MRRVSDGHRLRRRHCSGRHHGGPLCILRPLPVKFIEQCFTDYGVHRSWWPWLGTAKAAGAVGLLVGLFVPVIGIMAGIGLVLYFAGALITVVHATGTRTSRSPCCT